MIGGTEVSGLDQAMECVRAMEGQDEDTRRSLWRAALKFRKRDAADAPGDADVGRSHTRGGLGLVEHAR